MKRITQVAAVVAVALLTLLACAAPAWARQADDSGETGFKGTLQVDGSPLVGVTLSLTDLGGDELATTTSAEDGSWTLVSDQAGQLRLVLDEATLPEGVSVGNPDLVDREVAVRTGQLRTIGFPFVRGAPPDVTPGSEPSESTALPTDGSGTADEDASNTGASLTRRLLDSVNNGIKLGLIIAMASVGLSLIFGTTGLINFAHGELVTFGAVTAWFLNARGLQLPLIAAAVVAAIIAGALGLALERGLWRPVERRTKGSFQLLVISIGLSLVARHAIQLWFGVAPQRFVDYTSQSEIMIGPFQDTPRDFSIIGISFVLLVLVGLGVKFTRVGKAMRAVSDSRDLAESSGIDVKRIISFVWVLGTALAAIGGIMLGATQSIDDIMGFRLLLLMFAGIILGGLGTAYGAMVGGLVVGLATEVTTVWLAPELKNVWALVVLIGVLLIRPQGILGVKERVG